MCGIVGYVGKNEASPFLLTGLRRLEYRGYDSAGIVTLSTGTESKNASGFQLRRAVGRIDRLADLMEASPVQGMTGIGHTRWATHGPATTENAHPHIGGRGQVAVVHNGVIENYDVLKQALIAKGYVFQSATDTEVIAHLIADALKRTSTSGTATEGQNAVYLDAVREILPLLRGTYGLVVMFRDRPDLLIAARFGSPLVLGVGKNEQFIASDTSPLIGYTDRIIYLADHQLAVITQDSIQVLHRDKVVFALKSVSSMNRQRTCRLTVSLITCSRKSMNNRHRCGMRCAVVWIARTPQPSLVA